MTSAAEIANFPANFIPSQEQAPLDPGVQEGGELQPQENFDADENEISSKNQDITEKSTQTEHGDAVTPSKQTKKSDWMSNLKAGALRVFHAVKWVLLVILVFLVLAIIASWNMNRNVRYSKQELQNIRSLMLYAAKSAEEAERIGTDDPLQALLHANYAVCYVNAAKHMVDDKTIQGLLGSSVAELEQYLAQLQQTLLNQVEWQLAQQAASTRSQRNAMNSGAGGGPRGGVSVEEGGRRVSFNPAVSGAHLSPAQQQKPEQYGSASRASATSPLLVTNSTSAPRNSLPVRQDASSTKLLQQQQQQQQQRRVNAQQQFPSMATNIKPSVFAN